MNRPLVSSEMSREILSWNRNLQSCCGKGLHEQVLLLYRKMQQAGVRPNASTFPSLIRSCTDLSTPQLGEEIHADIIRSGCETDHYVGSALVHMYAKCQTIASAVRVFERLPSRSVVLWTSLIQGYAQIGSSNKAVEAFVRMQREDGCRPNEVTFVSLVPTLLHLKDGESLHAHAIQLGLESHTLLATSFTNMYLKFQAVQYARQVFHCLQEKNAVSWFVMVSGLAQNAFIGEAISLVSTMLWRLNLILDSTSLISLISACKNTRDLECGQWVHTYIIKVRLELDAFVGTALLDMYAKCECLELARKVFDEIHEPNLVSWNAIMYSYARQGFLEEFVELFWQLNQAGLFPDSVTIRSCFLALASSSSYQRESQLGECFHAFSVKGGFLDSEIETSNTLLDFYAKIGDLQSAEKLFFWIADKRDNVSWNCMINGYVQGGLYTEVMMLFHWMQLTCLVPDSFTLSSVLAVCACTCDWSLGQCTHAYLIKQGYSSDGFIWDSFVGTTLVDMYAKCGDVASAYWVFEEIHVSAKYHVTWNVMITGFSQNGYASNALALFSHCLKGDVKGKSSSVDTSMATAVSAYAELGCLEGGRGLHGYILRKGLEDDVKVGNAILSLYSKCGLVEDAESFFRMMAEKDMTTWTAMISGYGINGRVMDALCLFEEMLKSKKTKEVEGLKPIPEPNGVTYLEVLWACSQGGLVKEGWDYFQTMKRVHGIEAKVEHYCCVVDLLGRAGYLYEAYVLIRSMTVVRPDAAIWGALLGACMVYGELELGEIAGAELSSLENRNSGYRVLLSNAYATRELWECATRIREEVRMEGWRRNKLPGWSCIEVRD